MEHPEKRTLEQFVQEYGGQDRHDMGTYSRALAAVEQLAAEDPLAARAIAVVATQDAFEEAWRKLGGSR